MGVCERIGQKALVESLKNFVKNPREVVGGAYSGSIVANTERLIAELERPVETCPLCGAGGEFEMSVELPDLTEEDLPRSILEREKVSEEEVRKIIDEALKDLPLFARKSAR